MGVVHLTGDNFDEEVKKSDIPVLVDFFANWCGPCKMMGPVIEELAGLYEGKCKIAKLDVDGAQAKAAEFGVMSIPTIILFKGGEIVAKEIGAVPKEKLIELIDKNL